METFFGGLREAKDGSRKSASLDVACAEPTGPKPAPLRRTATCSSSRKLLERMATVKLSTMHWVRAGGVVATEERSSSSNRGSTESTRRNRRVKKRSLDFKAAADEEEADDLPRPSGFVSVLELLGGSAAVDELKDKKEVSFGEFHRDVQSVRARLARRQRGFLDPKARRMQAWDLLTSLALIFVVFVTPFEVAFLSDTRIDALFVCNQIVNCIFVIDIALTFATPFERKGELVLSHSAIIRRYLSFWLWVDLISVFPFDICYLAGLFGPPGSTNVSPSALRSIRLMRLVRLLKLIRVVRGSRILKRWEATPHTVHALSSTLHSMRARFSLWRVHCVWYRWEDSISVSSGVRALGFWVAFIIIALHLFSCFWALLALFQGSIRGMPGLAEALSERMAADATCTGCLHPSLHLDDPSCDSNCATSCELEVAAELSGRSVEDQRKQESWMCRYSGSGEVVAGRGPSSVYLVSLYTVVSMFAGGQGTIPPANDGEYAFTMVSNLLGLVLWAVVQGTICAFLSTGNPFETAYQADMDSLNFLMQDMALPRDLRRRVRAYMRMTKATKKRGEYNKLLTDRLSPELMAQVRFIMSRNVLGSVPYLGSLKQVMSHSPEGSAVTQVLLQHAARPHSHGEAPSDPHVTVTVTGLFQHAREQDRAPRLWARRGRDGAQHAAARHHVRPRGHGRCTFSHPLSPSLTCSYLFSSDISRAWQARCSARAAPSEPTSFSRAPHCVTSGASRPSLTLRWRPSRARSSGACPRSHASVRSTATCVIAHSSSPSIAAWSSAHCTSDSSASTPRSAPIHVVPPELCLA